MRPFEGADSTFKWGSITYQDFADAVFAAAAHWRKELSEQGLQPGDTVGMWLKGSHWTDLAHIYAVSAAGYVPEVFGQAFSALFVHDLLELHHAQVVIVDDSFKSLVADFRLLGSAIGVLSLPTLASLSPAQELSALLPDVQGDDVAMIFHTSGTTGGRPKPVPQTHRWLVAEAEVTWKGVIQVHPDGQHVFNNIGSFSSIGAASCVTFMAWSGACLTQSSGREITPDEFLGMVRECGLNFLLQYAPWMAKLIKAARDRADIFDALRGLRQIAYTGATLDPADEKWALEHGVPLTPMYANTECGPLMVARLSSGNSYLQPIAHAKGKLVPAGGEGKASATGALQLYDFYIGAESATCPHTSIRNRPDGHVTGDLFEEVEPGCYVFRGRSDDWIRTGGNPAFCDTKAIEENVMKTCGDLVHSCVVIGHQRVCPLLVVELLASGIDAADDPTHTAVRNEILERTAAFNSRLFPHEKITNPRCILVVPEGSLPRTTEKGNVRRKATEQQFQDKVDAIYASLV
ncbi:acetyl-CoA synthetase-like protein [Epithele typhae]|uniref:acetyl-CoA synthetase-like protein n=1 Tax=Epithele typhae TaxID=378194 RepID=UPI002007FF08|nr:acetyl-CoA synthetase-like protein [Epithele typhae]KAH9917141.1 acetyl-CoA synthetase-like protein [Epithele typhae]